MQSTIPDKGEVIEGNACIGGVMPVPSAALLAVAGYDVTQGAKNFK